MYLLDTHVIIWTLYDYKQLPERVVNIMQNEECCISIASLWEMAIKSGLKKLELDQSIKQIADSFEQGGIHIRSITPDDCDVVKKLPVIHKDPFDRIIIAQAMADRMTIITRDSFIPQYNVNTIWD